MKYLITAALVTTLSVFSVHAAEPQKRQVIAPTTNKPQLKINKARMQQLSHQRALMAAQAWLKSANRDHTLENIPKIKRIIMSLYGKVNGVPTQQIYSNENMKHLRVMTGLEQVSFPNWTTDAGAMNIANAKNLRIVGLAKTRVTNQTIDVLAKLPAIENLVLTKTNIDKHALVKLGQMQNLRILNLSDIQLTDQDLAPLAQLSRLETLFLMRTNITDASVATLSQIKSLKRLDVGSRISQQAKTQLKTAIPGIKIY